MDKKDIILTEKKVNFSMGAANPMAKVRPACDRISCEPTRLRESARVST